MHTYIALLRGINVGGHNKLPMKDLTALLESLGAQEVQTYIQSGNAVFRHQAARPDRLASRIGAAIKEGHGFEPQILLLAVDTLEKAIAANPFPDAEADPRRLHLYFLAAAPRNPDLETLDRLKQAEEQFALIDKVFYLHAPAGIGRSKLAAQAEKALGVSATARNWRTVDRILALAKQWS